MTPTSLRTVIADAALVALEGAGVTLPFYADKEAAPVDTDPALSDGYISVDWTGVGRQGPLATGLEKGIVGPTFQVFAQTSKEATDAAGVLARYYRAHPQIDAPAGDVGWLSYAATVPCQEVGVDPRRLYVTDTVILFNHYDPD